MDDISSAWPRTNLDVVSTSFKFTDECHVGVAFAGSKDDDSVFILVGKSPEHVTRILKSFFHGQVDQSAMKQVVVIGVKKKQGDLK